MRYESFYARKARLASPVSWRRWALVHAAFLIAVVAVPFVLSWCAEVPHG